MTYDSEPVRWTDVPGEAPDLLRGAFDACRREGPNDFQMRSLALKLAVVGSGAAIAASTSIASAASLGKAGSVASIGSMAKVGAAAGGVVATATSGSAVGAVKVVAMSVALLGAAATGVVMVKQADPPVEPQSGSRLQQVPVERAVEKSAEQPLVIENDPAQHPVPIVQDLSAPAPVRGEDSAAPEPRSHGRRHHPGRSAARERERNTAAVASAEEPATRGRRAYGEAASEDATSEQVRSESSTRAERRAERQQARIERALRASSGGLPEVPGASAGEISLLRSARAALSARPKLAFELTEQHRDEYPDGVFTQERDALAIEALMRAGDMDGARGRAESFVHRYPESPHAHRFRETMNIQ